MIQISFLHFHFYYLLPLSSALIKTLRNSISHFLFFYCGNSISLLKWNCLCERIHLQVKDSFQVPQFPHLVCHFIWKHLIVWFMVCIYFVWSAYCILLDLPGVFTTQSPTNLFFAAVTTLKQLFFLSFLKWTDGASVLNGFFSYTMTHFHFSSLGERKSNRTKCLQ